MNGQKNTSQFGMTSAVRKRRLKGNGNQADVVETWKKKRARHDRKPKYVTPGQTKKSQSKKSQCVDIGVFL